MNDIFRHIHAPDQTTTDIPNVIEELGLESAARIIEQRTDNAVYQNKVLVGILSKIDVALETTQLTEEEANFLFGDDAISNEDITAKGYKVTPTTVFNRVRELFATAIVEPFDQVGDLYRGSNSSIRKYKSKVAASKDLIKNKKISLDDAQVGALGTLVEYFHNELGYTSNITEVVNRDLEMVSVVLEKNPDILMEQLESVFKSKGLKDDDANKLKHPVSLFPEEWLDNNLFLRGLGFKVSGNFDRRLTGWEGLAQSAKVVTTSDSISKFVSAKAALMFLPVLSPATRTMRYAFRATVAGLAPDVDYTVDDLYSFIDQFEQYEKILRNYAASIDRYKKQAKQIAKGVKDLDLEDKDFLADLISFASISIVGLTVPGKDVLYRSIRVMRGMAYLINRMAKFAK